MIHVQYSWLKDDDIGNLYMSGSTFITFNGNKMWHSPDYQYKEVPADEVYGGPPAAYNVTVEEWWCYQTDLCSGKTKIRTNSGWDFLTEGPKLFNWYLGNHMIICEEDVCPYEIDGKNTFSVMNKTTQELLHFLKFDPSLNIFSRRKNLMLPDNISIQSGDVKSYDSYSWSENYFELDGKKTTFEKLLRWSLTQPYNPIMTAGRNDLNEYKGSSAEGTNSFEWQMDKIKQLSENDKNALNQTKKERKQTSEDIFSL